MEETNKKLHYVVFTLLVLVSVSGMAVHPLLEMQTRPAAQPSELAAGPTPDQAATIFPNDTVTPETNTFTAIATSSATTSGPDIDISLSPYIEVVDSCGPYYQGNCVNMRSRPGTEYPILARLRKGVVLKVADVTEIEGKQWYSVFVDDVLQHPERVISDWYVSADTVQIFYDDGDHALQSGAGEKNQKHILVDVSNEMLYAYDGDVLFMQEPISTGLDKTPTPIGTFKIFKKTPSRYMQGPVEGVSDQYYDLPGVPWNLYFSKDGAVIHGAYWHDHFGHPWSHGCVNLPPEKAKKLYEWATVGTEVKVQE